MGVEHDAASFGAYDGNSSRGSKLLDAEHASYSAEQCIERLDRQRGVVSPARSSFSSPDLDLEDSYYDSCSNGRSVEGASGYNISRGSATRTSSVGSRTSYFSSEDSFVSVDVGCDSVSRFDSTIDEGMSHLPHELNYFSQCQDDEDAIKAGIMDISAFLATYLAGGISFVIGKFDSQKLLCDMFCRTRCKWRVVLFIFDSASQISHVLAFLLLQAYSWPFSLPLSVLSN